MYGHEIDFGDIDVEGNKGFDEDCYFLNTLSPLDVFVFSDDVFYLERGGDFIDSLIGEFREISD